MPPRVEAARGLREPGEEDGLRQIEIGGGLAEIRASGGLGAEQAVAVVHRVEIALEDLWLGPTPLKFTGDGGLAEFVGDRARWPAGRILHELLRDGRGARHGAEMPYVPPGGAD